MTPFAYAMTTYAATLGMAVTAFVHPAPRLIWNASESIAVGLYAASPAHGAGRGDLVAIAPPAKLAALMAERRYLPLSLPLLKPVAAIGGQLVCRKGVDISIDGQRVGDALARDRHGRDLPVWHGCHRLGSNELFVMNPASRDSFDGRYFGALPMSAVRARLRPLWTSKPTVDAGVVPVSGLSSSPAAARAGKPCAN